MILWSGISDSQSTHLSQEPRSCVQTKTLMFSSWIRHLPVQCLCTRKRRRNVRATKRSGDSLLWTRNKPKKQGRFSLLLPLAFFFLALTQMLFVGQTTLLSQCSFDARVVKVIDEMSGTLDKLLAGGGGDYCTSQGSTLESFHFRKAPCITRFDTRDQYLSNFAPTPPWPNNDPNSLSVDCCWFRGGVGAQLLRYSDWSDTSILFTSWLLSIELVQTLTYKLHWTVTSTTRNTTTGQNTETQSSRSLAL